MRILWFSNAPWMPTGYGTQTAEVVRRMVADGHAVAISANAGLSGSPMEWEGIPVLPTGHDIYSNDIAPVHAIWWAQDEPLWIITLFDVWVLQGVGWDEANVASWVPVERMPAPERVIRWCRERPIAGLSRWGQSLLQAGGIEHADYIPHGIDLGTFQPRELLANGMKPRDVMGVPKDAFLVTINAANKGAENRKAWDRMFLALGVFMDRHPDVHVYAHTEPIGIAGAPDLRVLAAACAIPDARLHWADAYGIRSGRYPASALAAVYTTSDVHLLTSKGEGFGIPVIEAAACGTPSIVSAFSAQPELVEGYGWTVAGQLDWEAALGAWWFDPFVDDILAKLEDAYADRGNAERSAAARAKAAEYDADRIYADHWRPFLAGLEKKPNRAERRAARKLRTVK